MKTQSRAPLATTAAMLLAAIMLAGAVTGCSHPERDRDLTGSATMEISLPNGSQIASVHYSITGNGIPPIEETIDIHGANASASFQVTGIPAGTGYTIHLDAKSADNSTSCTGTASFDITPGATTHVTLLLHCTGANTGTVVVNDVWCPMVSSYSVSPLTPAVGGTISVKSKAYDIDTADDATPTFLWTASAGSFADAHAANTTYTCATAGSQTLTITVSAISPTTDVTACTSTSSTTVTCVPQSCGNGTLDPGEQCDPPNGTTCDANCLQIPVCGNGVVEAPAGPYRAEQCDPPNGTTCDATCQNILAVCGNGTLDPGEQCDPPNGTTCDSTCHLIQGPRCGDGIVQPGEDCDPPNGTTCDSTCHSIQGPRCGDGIVQPGEDCDPPNGTTCDSTCHSIQGPRCGDGVVQPGEDCEPPGAPATNFTPACDASCKFTGRSLCSACEASKCDTFFGSQGAWGCDDLTGAAKAGCQGLLSCIRTTHCAAATHDAQACYCGTASDLACLTGAANGQCKSAYETAAGTTDPGIIAGLFTDPTSAVGRADNQITCDTDASTPPVCASVCPL